MPRWSAERRNVPIARDVGRLESVQAGVTARPNGASQAPSAVSALRSPSLGREGFSKDTARPAPQNKRAAKRWLRRCWPRGWMTKERSNAGRAAVRAESSCIEANSVRSRGSGSPVLRFKRWVPLFAGTNGRSNLKQRRSRKRACPAEAGNMLAGLRCRFGLRQNPVEIGLLDALDRQ